MYDENLAILEDADYAADMFWLEGEESDDSFPFGVDEEMDMVSLDRAAALIQEMTNKFDNIAWNADGAIARLRESAYSATKSIEEFLNAYTQLREMGN